MNRTRSKWFATNLCRWLHPDDLERYPLYPITDYFTEINGEMYLPYALAEDNLRATKGSIVIDRDEEYAKRIRLILAEKDCVIKIHPNESHELRAINQLQYNVDKVFKIVRRDRFNCCLSLHLALYHQVWSNGPKMDQVLSGEPINLSPRVFNELLHRYESQLDYLIRSPGTLIICDHAEYIQDSRTFCNYFGLPVREFDLDNTHDVEFGNVKEKLVANYDILKSLDDNYKRA